MLRLWLQRIYAPGFVLGFLGLALAFSPPSPLTFGAPSPPSKAAQPLALAGLLALAIVVSFLVERVIPYQHVFNRPRGDLGRDLAHAVVNEAANVSSVIALPLLAAWLPATDFWPSAWPLALQLGLAVGIADFGISLAHFVSHRVDWLWRFHAVHHSVERMYGFNGLMKHPLHQTFELVCGTTPLVLMGMPVEVAWLLAFAVAIQLLLQHSNADLRVGFLARVWAVAPVHRFHHLNRAGEGDVNFGLFTAIWDHLLGTYHYDPKRGFDVGDLGVEGRPDYPRAYLEQLAAPFQRELRRRQASQTGFFDGDDKRLEPSAGRPETPTEAGH